MTDLDQDRMFSLEARPQQPTPAMLTFRRNIDGFPEVVMQEDKAFEIYLLLKEHFEGESVDDTTAYIDAPGYAPRWKHSNGHQHA